MQIGDSLISNGIKCIQISYNTLTFISSIIFECNILIYGEPVFSIISFNLIECWYSPLPCSFGRRHVLINNIGGSLYFPPISTRYRVSAWNTERLSCFVASCCVVLSWMQFSVSTPLTAVYCPLWTCGIS